jgi:hypothetical protein
MLPPLSDNTSSSATLYTTDRASTVVPVAVSLHGLPLVKLPLNPVTAGQDTPASEAGRAQCNFIFSHFLNPRRQTGFAMPFFATTWPQGERTLTRINAVVNERFRK